MKGRPRPPEARRSAFKILRRVEEGGAYASVLLEREEMGFPDPRDSALLHELVLGVLRNQVLLDDVLSRVASRPVALIDPPIRTALRIGAYEILFLDRVPAFATVDSAVDLVKRSGFRAGAGFVNAVLRAVAAQESGRLPSPPERGDVSRLALLHSHPRWWVERAVNRLGWDEAVRLLEANNAQAATVLRPNLRRTTPRDLALRLEAEGVMTEPCRFLPEALRVRSGVAQRTRTFHEGYAWIQDEASQLAARLFGRVLRPRVADVCAAPGAKALQLAQSLPTPGILLAADRHVGRLGRLRQNLRRLKIDNVLVVAADMTARPPLRGPFDHVLVDAPCSGTGTLRRHPEIRWRLTPEDLTSLANRQAKLLHTAAGLLRCGGTLVYSVCSLEPEEGEQVVTGFLSRHPGFRPVDPRPALPETARDLIGGDGAFRTSPAEGGLDGFYAALLLREG